MKRFYLPMLAVLVAFLATACSSKMKPLTADYFTVTPQVLEAVGGQVPATINGKFPEKYFNKKAVVKVTPVLRWNGGQAAAESVTFQGEKVQGNSQTISYAMGGNYTIRTKFDYRPEMAKSELYLDIAATIGKKTINLPSIKVADGVIATSELVENTLNNANVALGEDAFQRVIQEKRNAQIMFLIQQANVRSSELGNSKQLAAEAKDVNDASNKRINNIQVSAYASPDGAFDLNSQLAEKRQDNTAAQLSKDLKKQGVTDANINTEYTAEDWEGFQELVAKSNIQDKELILRVLSMYTDPQQREQEIKNISSVYSNLADEILPQLRRSRITLNYEVIGKSDVEISSLARNNASALSIEELLYAATLTNDQVQKEVIYAKAAQLFPNDYRATNNLGLLAYKAGDIDKAEGLFKQAAQIKDAPEVNNNLALVSMIKGNNAAAEQYIGKAAGAKEVSETMANLYLRQGQYERAVNAFADSKTNSAALAQILNKDYNKARNTLDSMDTPDAYTSYLKAVVGARTNNKTMLIDNLRQAIAKNPVLAKKAASDLEFAKFFTNAEFAALVH